MLAPGLAFLSSDLQGPQKSSKICGLSKEWVLRYLVESWSVFSILVGKKKKVPSQSNLFKASLGRYFWLYTDGVDLSIQSSKVHHGG